MTVSTVTLNPGSVDGPGLGVMAETDRQALDLLSRELGATVIRVHEPVPGHDSTGRELVERVGRPDFTRWRAQAARVGSCVRPVRLHGSITTVNRATGEVDQVWHTDSQPDGVIYRPCGDRRASVCPGCAETYRRDAFHLIRAGLIGGLGVPETVTGHPCVFVTLTALSFGPVHSTRKGRNGRLRPCRPRRKPERCSHGVDLRCMRVHRDGEACLGQPLCRDCYDYPAHVVWNAHAAELWRRTTVMLRRALDRRAKARGTRIRLSFGKVAEFQARGVVHFHALIRLDGHDLTDPDRIVRPQLTIAELTDAVYAAVRSTVFRTRPHPRNPAGWVMAWGDQVDLRPVSCITNGDVTDSKVVGYLAKYATKTTEPIGTVSVRITAANLRRYADSDTHVGRLIAACWHYGSYDDPWFRALRRWAHMIGFRGHFFTKSRRYSSTFQERRCARQHWQIVQQKQTAENHDSETAVVIRTLKFVGVGWLTIGDALLAQTAAARAREHRQASWRAA